MSGLPTGRPAGALDARSAWQRLLTVRTGAQAEAAGLRPDGHGRYRWRESASASAEADLLAERYLPLCLAGPRFAFAQLGQSLDGFIATREGDADYVTGPEDREHLHRLRALSDAVVVGAGTAVADDPRLTVRACAGPDPVRVVLDPHGRVPSARRLFTDGAAPTLWVVGAGSVPGRAGADGTADAGVDVLVLPDTAAFAPRRLVHELARRGLGRVLVEGGGVTVSRFLHEGALDRLYITVAPVLIGDGVPGLAFPGPDAMRDALRPPVRRAFLGDDTLYELDLRAPRSGEPLDGEHDGTGKRGGEGQ
ncbi:RibD family protein [Streptomyces pacificus]|uniref:RibD family protein n=1 Tax=Streptomyces pacificus TaxID=2705029 RepID=A0A6A0AU04_9ACTN|nr:RibD family protein [Streptomyces pacificus]GFH36400.1 RibD family protein [Streptomyces pacificus]